MSNVNARAGPAMELKDVVYERSVEEVRARYSAAFLEELDAWREELMARLAEESKAHGELK